jgi:hypothetical protein
MLHIQYKKEPLQHNYPVKKAGSDRQLDDRALSPVKAVPHPCSAVARTGTWCENGSQRVGLLAMVHHLARLC